MQPLSSSRRLRVLIADDDPGILELVTARLDLAGYISCKAKTGIECLSRLTEQRVIERDKALLIAHLVVERGDIEDRTAVEQGVLIADLEVIQPLGQSGRQLRCSVVSCRLIAARPQGIDHRRIGRLVRQRQSRCELRVGEYLTERWRDASRARNSAD